MGSSHDNNFTVFSTQQRQLNLFHCRSIEMKTKMIKENVFNIQIFTNYPYFKINNY